ncbi:MAG TPA: Ig-like domain-containing protein [Anaerolineae bacterium]|nr:Ig-like domain-containing protein [Anaerolineae bacterium]
MNRIYTVLTGCLVAVLGLMSLFWIATTAAATAPAKSGLNQKQVVAEGKARLDQLFISNNDTYTTVTNVPIVASMPLSSVLVNDTVVPTMSWSMIATDVATGTLEPLWDLTYSNQFTSSEIPAIKLINNQLAIAYGDNINDIDGINRELYYVAAIDARGSSWLSPTLITTLASHDMDKIWQPSLNLFNGQPAIAYNTPTNIYYAAATNSSGTNWEIYTVTHAIGADGVTLLDINGLPAIAYESHENFISKFYFVRALTSDGSSWSDPIPLTPPIDGNFDDTLLITHQEIDGRPALVYNYSASEPIFYHHALDPQGLSWGQPITLGHGSWPRFHLAANGTPLVAYSDNQQTYLLHSPDNGTTWLSRTIVPSPTTPLLLNDNHGQASLIYAQGISDSDFGITTISATQGRWDNNHSWSQFPIANFNFHHSGIILQAYQTNNDLMLMNKGVEPQTNKLVDNLIRIQWNGRFAYDPPPDYTGTVTFTYYTQQADSTSSATVNLLIEPNSPPQPAPDTYEMPRNNQLIVDNITNSPLANDTDDANSFEAHITQLPHVGELNYLGAASLITATTIGENHYKNLQWINDKPAITYMNDNGLYYQIANDHYGQTWSNAIQLDENHFYWFNFLLIDTQPTVIYLRRLNNISALMYTYALDAEGLQWSEPLTITTTPINPSGIVSTIVHGLPAIVYADGSDIKYIRADNLVGTSWTNPITIVTATDVVLPKMIMLNGKPMVQLMENVGSSQHLYHIQANDPLGSSWASPTTPINANRYDDYFLHILPYDLINIQGTPMTQFITEEQLNYISHIHYIRPIGDEHFIWHITDSSQLNENNLLTSNQTVYVNHIENKLLTTDMITNNSYQYQWAYDPLGIRWQPQINLSLQSEEALNYISRPIISNNASDWGLVYIDNSDEYKLYYQTITPWDGLFTYTPPPDFSGVVTFTYQLDDGYALSAPQIVTITVNESQAPMALADHYEIPSNYTLTVPAPGILANDISVTGPLTPFVEMLPASGALELAVDGAFTYTPAVSMGTVISFSYRATDGEWLSEPAEVTINLLAPNQLPLGRTDFYFLPAGEVALQVGAANGVLANDTDPNHDALQVELVRDVEEGLLSLAGDGAFVYLRPSDGGSGMVTFQYRVYDGWGWSQPVSSIIGDRFQLYLPVVNGGEAGVN